MLNFPTHMSFIIILLISTLNHYGCNGCISVSDCVTFPTYTESCNDYSNSDHDSTEWKLRNVQLPTYRKLGYTQTVANFEHWLGNTGNPLEIDKEFLLKYPPVRKRIQENINTIICGNPKTGGGGIIGRGRKLATGQAKQEKICFCAASYATFGTDLWGAIGGFTIHTSAETCIKRADNEIIFTMDEITHTFYDKYDWDPSQWQDYYCFEEAGRAQSFIVKTEWKDGDGKISGSIDANSLDCKYQRDDSEDACKSPPLIFVVDRSGSMNDDIAAVQSKIKSIIDNKKDTINEPRLYVLSVFEQSVTVTSTTDSNVILNAVNSITTGGGTEYSMTAILRAAKFADQHSVIWLFTDEDADDEHLRGTVIAELKRKKIKLNTFISVGSRRRLLPTGIALYAALAFETGGIPIYTTHTDVINVIDIVDTFTSRGTTTLYLAVKTNNTASTEITIPIDSTIQKVSFIISTSVSSSVEIAKPYIIVQPVSANVPFTQNVTLATQTLYVMETILSNDNSFGDYNIIFGTNNTVDFLLLQIVCETSLSFDFYLSTNSVGTDSQLFEGISPSQFLTVTVVPSDVNLLNTVDSISMVSRDGDVIISNSDISIDVDGYSVTFNPDDYKTVNNVFRIAVSGKDANNYRFYRMMSEEVIVQGLQLNVLNTLNTEIIVETWIDVLFEVKSVNVTAFDMIQFSATSDYYDQVELLVDPASTTLTPNATAKLYIFVRDSTLIGEELYITLTAINTETDEYAHKQIAFTIVSNITDTIPPQCQFVNNTYTMDCDLFDSTSETCNSSFWSAIIYVSDTNNKGSMDNNYGISWITTINDDPDSYTILSDETHERTTEFIPGTDELYLLYTSSCCNTYSQFIVRDLINQISNCELNVASKCEPDNVFGDAYLNETITVNCADIENNTYFIDGNLRRKCMANGKWEDIVTGSCNAVTSTSTKKTNNTAAVVIAVLCIVAVVALIIGCYCFYRSKDQTGKGHTRVSNQDIDMDTVVKV